MKKIFVLICVIVFVLVFSVSSFAESLYPSQLVIPFVKQASDSYDFFITESSVDVSIDSEFESYYLSSSFNGVPIPSDQVEVSSIWGIYSVDFILSNFETTDQYGSSHTLPFSIHITNVPNTTSLSFHVSYSPVNAELVAQEMITEFNSVYGTDFVISGSSSYSGSSDHNGFFYFVSESGKSYDFVINYFQDTTNDFSDFISLFGTFGSFQLNIWYSLVNFIMKSSNTIILVSFLAWLFITGLGMIRRFIRGV